MVTENEILKTWNFIDICLQNEMIWKVQMIGSLHTCCKINVIGESWNIGKNSSQKDPNKLSTSKPKTLRDYIFEIWGVLEGTEMENTWFWTEKLNMKSKKSKIWRPKVVQTLIGAGPAECAEPVEASQLASSPCPIWHASSPERGRQIQSLTRIPPGHGVILVRYKKTWLFKCTPVVNKK
jgi:hypothetical protein